MAALALVGGGLALGLGTGLVQSDESTLFVDRSSLGGRCDDDRDREEVSVTAPWCSLGRALEAAGGGRTVLVRAGSYPRLELRGRRSEYLTLKPFPRERVTLAGVYARDSTFLERGVHAGDASFVRLEGFRISGPLELLFGTRNVRVVGNDISSYLHLRLTRDVLIEGNHIHDTPAGVRAIGADGYAQDPARAGIHNLTVRDNRIERASYDALAVYGGAYGLLVEGNEISQIYKPPGSDLHVDGIQTQGGRGIVIRDNFIHHVDQGIMLSDRLPLEDLLIQNNTVVRTGGWGIRVLDAPNARIVNNTVWHTGAGLGIADLREIPGPTSVTLEKNIIDWLQLQHPNQIASQDHNLIARSPRLRLPSKDWPRFRNPGELDYRLSSGGPGSELGLGAERVR